MTSVFHSLAPDHDVRLVLLAAMICAFGALSTMNVAARAAGPRRGLWLALLSICAAATVWATHFIAMLAYRQGVPTTYDPWLTALSFVAGMVMMGLGFAMAVHGADDRRMRVAGGAVVGVGVVALHYIGMAALRMPGELTYAPALVATSVLFSVGFGAPSLAVALGPARPSARPIGALLMAAMILSLHFTAMGAVHLHEGMAGPSMDGGLTRTILAAAVATASVSVLLIAIVGSLIDQRVSRRLAAEAERFRTLAEGAFEGLIVHREGIVMDANATARRLLGLEDGASGQSIAECFRTALDLGGPIASEAPVEVTLQRADGSQFPAEVCRRRIQLSDGREGELCAIRDLTFRKESEARIAHLALHDTLTDLPNRRFFMELAQKVLSRATRTRTPFALLTLDLDDFKIVNDTHGHTAGDDVIRVVAQRIASTLRDSDVAARFGGDEFAILQLGVSQPGQAMALADRLLATLQAPVELAYGEVLVSASIGIAIHPDDGVTIEDLLRNADTAMYRAKADGKSMICFFEPHMEAALLARRSLEQGLRRAVVEKRFSVAYQPIVESRTRQPLGFEALVRWHDSERGTVMPADFIPVAEETGLIVPIGEFVLRQACSDAMSWPDDLRVAVNLSAVQFRRQGLVETVRRALEESGLPGHRLELEITETLLVDNRQDALHVLNQLKDLGVRISMDDFGTGYSALSYLQSFPFDKIKIDRVFVADLGCNPQNASIVRAVAAMGRSLQMRVVAEGVETDSEADILKGFDCDEIQGYLIARPMPASDVDQFLRDHALDNDAAAAFSGPGLGRRASA
jgi:diguanylate cyclase (GGDEF)-like protein/PAS domain S-box-containing protein